MDTAATIGRLLYENWPDECELAGNANVKLITNAVAVEGSSPEFRRAPGLANWDSDSIKSIVEIATLLKTCIDIWIALSKDRRKPTAQEFAAAASNQLTTHQQELSTIEHLFELLSRTLPSE